MSPIGHAWYSGLDRYVSRIAVPKTARFVGLKVAADTFLFGPLHVGLYFSLMTKLSGGSWKDVQKKIKSDFAGTFGGEVVFWVPLQTLNFSLVHPKHRESRDH